MYYSSFHSFIWISYRLELVTYSWKDFIRFMTVKCCSIVKSWTNHENINKNLHKFAYIRREWLIDSGIVFFPLFSRFESQESVFIKQWNNRPRPLITGVPTSLEISKLKTIECGRIHSDPDDRDNEIRLTDRRERDWNRSPVNRFE